MCAHQPYPLYPLPLIKGKGNFIKRGANAPLKHPTYEECIGLFRKVSNSYCGFFLQTSHILTLVYVILVSTISKAFSTGWTGYHFWC